MTTATLTPPAYTVAAACRRLRISPAAFRRGWAGVFTRHADERGRVRLLRDEVDEASQHGTRDAQVAAVLRYRRATGRYAG